MLSLYIAHFHFSVVLDKFFFCQKLIRETSLHHWFSADFFVSQMQEVNIVSRRCRISRFVECSYITKTTAKCMILLSSFPCQNYLSALFQSYYEILFFVLLHVPRYYLLLTCTLREINQKTSIFYNLNLFLKLSVWRYGGYQSLPWYPDEFC